jgi:CO/xanthine dehydrogenase Mo-binding subunit
MLGEPIPRFEDDQLLRGSGTFVGNLQLPDMLYASLVRSPHAAARILEIQTLRARSLPGVHAVWTFYDLAEILKPIPQIAPHPALRSRTPYPLAHTVVHHEGEALAIVAAETPTICREALHAIEVRYEAFPAVLNAESGMAPGSVRVHDDLPDNCAAHFGQEAGNFDAALAACACVINQRLSIGRISAQPLETRGIVARFEPSMPSPRLTVWFNTQSPHTARSLLAQQLNLARNDVRVIAPDIGGGFGVKNRYYPENTLVPLLALRLGRPVKWVESRRESFLCTYQEREQIHDVTLGLDAEGRIAALRDRILYDQGAYATLGIVVPHITSVSVPGPYRVPNYQVECTAVYTHKTPSAPYRGAGKPQACFVMERMLDAAAAQLGIDPVEIRRRNLIQPEHFPYDTRLRDLDDTNVIYDSGSYPECLQRALDLIGQNSFQKEKRDAAEAGRRLGLGVACFIEMTGRGPYESALVRVEPGGRIILCCGISSQGQGHATTLAQVCAHCLQVDPASVLVQLGDTASIPLAIGVYAARSAVMAGNAVAMASTAIRDKVVKAAAAMLRVRPEAVAYSWGNVTELTAPHRTLSLAEVANRLHSPAPLFPFPAEIEPGLEALRFYRGSQPAYSNGVYAAVVEVDPGTGFVGIIRHAMVHDCGNLINRAVVETQMVGGVAQGIGAVLFEELRYGGDGRLLNGSLDRYLLPRATEIPTLRQAHVVTPSPFNPLGVKGVGEGGTIPVSAAIAAAIEHALGSGPQIARTPITPPQVLSLAISVAQTREESNRREANHPPF